MIIQIENRKNPAWLKQVIVGKDGMGKEQWFTYYYENGKIKETPQSSQLFPGNNLSDLYISEVKEGRLTARIPVSIKTSQVECPFCFTINDFNQQKFCQHFFSLSEGPTAIFIIGDKTSSKVVSVWEGACNIFLEKPTEKLFFKDFTKFIYRTEDRYSRGKVVIFDHKGVPEREVSKGLVNIVFNQEYQGYSVIIFPCFSSSPLKHLFAVQHYTIDKDIKDIKAEEDKSNPIWKFGVVGRTDRGTENLIYATITSFTHPFIIRSINKTRIVYKILQDWIHSFTEEEYKKELYQKETKKQDIGKLLTIFKNQLTPKEKEELKKLLT